MRHDLRDEAAPAAALADEIRAPARLEAERGQPACLAGPALGHDDETLADAQLARIETLSQRGDRRFGVASVDACGDQQ